MKKIISIMVIISILILAGVFIAYLIDNNGHLNENDAKYFTIEEENKTDLTVSSEGPIPLYKIIDEIKNSPFHEGYNKDTLLWMTTLTQDQVFISNNSYVIMNKIDASKLNTEYVTDAYTVEYIDCIIIENRSLGGKHPRDILIVESVEYKGNYTHYFEV